MAAPFDLRSEERNNPIDDRADVRVAHLDPLDRGTDKFESRNGAVADQCSLRGRVQCSNLFCSYDGHARGRSAGAVHCAAAAMAASRAAMKTASGALVTCLDTASCGPKPK